VLLAWETIICIIMLLPLYLPLASLGGAIGGYVRLNYCEKTNLGMVSCVSIFPLLVSPIETPIQSPEIFHSVNNTIEINAPAEEVWRSIPNIENIKAEELKWNLSHFIGIPKPVSALTPVMKTGAIRELNWEKGVHFQEKITHITKNKRLAYKVIVDQESMKIAALDTHIVVGDEYFDVVSGFYQLETRNGKTLLTLSTKYRMTSKVNWYGSFWANFVLDDFHSSVLTLLKNRIESKT
jgi:ligand-binding SRPBCC domain-containing protein